MLRQSFTDFFIFATSADGSDKAVSYVRALDMLVPILMKHYPNPIIGAELAKFISAAAEEDFRR